MTAQEHNDHSMEMKSISDKWNCCNESCPYVIRWREEKKDDNNRRDQEQKDEVKKDFDYMDFFFLKTGKRADKRFYVTMRQTREIGGWWYLRV